MSLRDFSIFLYVISLVPIGLGFYKIFVYDNTDNYFSNSKNVYVGSDAHNYIINANYAIAYFVLAVFLALIASALLIVSYLKNNKEQDTATE